MHSRWLSRFRYYACVIILSGIFTNPAASGMFIKTLNQVEFKELLVKTASVKNQTLSHFKIAGFEFPVAEIQNVHFKDVHWSNISAKGRIFKNITFSDCKLENINYRNVKFDNVVFDNCELINVVMSQAEVNHATYKNSRIISTDPNTENNHRNLSAGKISFINSELRGLNYYHSKGDFIFEDSKLNDVRGYGLVKGSSITIIGSKLNYFDFSDSTLDSLIVRGSSVDESKLNGGIIDSIILENNDFKKFPIAEGQYKTLTANKTKNIIIGSSSVVNAEINNCGDTSDLFLGGMKNFTSISISGCDPSEFVFFDVVGKELKISNMEAHIFDFENASLDTLVLNNVTIAGKIISKNSKIKNYIPHNVKVLDGVKVIDKNSNIKIITTP